jgi:nitrate/nitrite transporter NarK
LEPAAGRLRAFLFPIPSPRAILLASPENLVCERGAAMKLLRSIASVVVSYIVVYGIVFASDPILSHLFPAQYVSGKVPPTFLIWVSTAIFAVASILGGWLCVKIAPSKQGTHLLVLFAVGEALGIFFTVHNWGVWPHWYSLVWLIVWPVFLWIGGKLGK